jgi:anti-sigma regulatory factor (Ser/Thr protein kinase)
MDPPAGMLQLPSTPEAADLARTYVRGLGSSWPADRLDTVLLLVSETVTNAVRYGHGRVELELTWSDGSVRIEVSDANPDAPIRHPLSSESLPGGGLGLHLLDALTDAWGTQSRREPPGKTVWLAVPVSAQLSG